MKDRILSVAVALSLLAVVFVAIPSPADAAIYYTGTVQTTDDAGDPEDVFFLGDPVYVAVETFFEGNATNLSIRVELQTPTGAVRTWFEAWTGVTETGLYESWTDAPIQWLNTWWGFDGEIMIYDVVAFANNGDWWDPWEEIDRVQITVRNEGLWLDPPSSTYYPGQEVQVKLVTSNTDDFYMQVVNDTYVDIFNNSAEGGEETVDGSWYYLWTIDNETADGTYWLNIRDESDHSTWYSVMIQIAKYLLTIDSASYFVLPGETVAITYDVVDVATLTPHTGVSIEWRAEYFDEEGDEMVDTGAQDTSRGTFYYDVAEDIALWSDIDLTVWANESDERSSEDWLEFTVGRLIVDLDMDAGPYLPGDSVTVEVQAFIGVDWTEWLEGAEVDLMVEYNGTELAAYGASGMVTDMTGVVMHEFTLANDSAKGTYVVTAVVSKLGSEVTRMATFNVEWGGSLSVEFNKEYYYSGQEASFDFKVVWNNEVQPATSVYYQVYGNGGLLKTGNSTTGSASYTIEDGYVGWISVEAMTVLNGYYYWAADSADVLIADVFVVAEKWVYRAGETVTWTYQITGGIGNATISYAITDDDDLRITSGGLPYALTGEVEFDVPETDPSESYTLEVKVDDGLGHIASDSATVSLYADYEISVWLESSAGFTSGAYEPGDTMRIGYSITTVGVDHMDLYMIWFYSEDDWIDHTVLVTETTGTFDFVIDEGAADGDYWLYADLYDPVGDDWLSWDHVVYSVQADQSTWDKSVGGLSLFDMLVLVLLLVMVILLIVVPFLRGRAGAEKAEKPRSMEHVPPPEPEPAPAPEPEELPKS